MLGGKKVHQLLFVVIVLLSILLKSMWWDTVSDVLSLAISIMCTGTFRKVKL